MKKLISILTGLTLVALSNSAAAVVIPGYGNVTNWATSAHRISGTGGTYAGVDAVTALIGDDLTDGAININTSDKFGLGFSTAIINNSGADLLIFDSRFSADGVYLEVNGTELLVQASSFVDTTLDLVLKNTSLNFNLYAAAVDLSGWGVASGAAINSLAIRGTGQSDIMGVAGLNSTAVPLPSTLLLLGMSLIAVALAKGKRRRGLQA